MKKVIMMLFVFILLTGCSKDKVEVDDKTENKEPKETTYYSLNFTNAGYEFTEMLYD